MNNKKLFLTALTTLFVFACVSSENPEKITKNSGDEDLVQLISQAESMDDKEREYWLYLLPNMDDAQKDKLRRILETERQKLAEAEKNYAKQTEELNKKHQQEWDDLQKELQSK